MKTGRSNSGRIVQETSTAELNCVTLVRERTIPAERPPLVGEVSANFCATNPNGRILDFLDPLVRSIVLKMSILPTMMIRELFGKEDPVSW
jgi:hypothetical protein